MDTNGTVLAVRENNSSYEAAYNIAPDTLMFQGEPEVDGSPAAPTYVTHFWNLSSGATEDFPNVISEHDFQYDAVNNTFLTLQQYVQPCGNNLYLIDKIVQLSPDGAVLWSWNPYNHIPMSEASPFNETATLNGRTVIDFTHANTLDWDYNDGVIYLNLRNLNTFYEINQTNGDIIWSCGEWGNFKLLGANSQPLVGANGLPPSLWYHCHTVEKVAPDVFILFNNDYENNTNPDDCRSSLMEVTLNETSMTARVNWSWEAPTSYWNEYGGSIVKLPNGDFMGCFGDPTHQYAQNSVGGTWGFNDTGAVFVEVNPAGQVVRTFTFPVGCYAYRVETVTDPSSIVFAPTSLVTPAPTPVGPTSTSISQLPIPNITPAPTSATPTSAAPTPTPTSPIPIRVATPTLSASPSPPSQVSIISQEKTVIIALAAVVVVAVVVVPLALFYPRKGIRGDQS